MNQSIIVSILASFLSFSNSIAQNLVEGGSKSLLYKSGSAKNAELQISKTETISIEFTTRALELYYIGPTNKMSLNNIEENDDWKLLQICVYDFDKNGVNEIVIAYGDGLTNLKVSIYNRVNKVYKEIGSFEGQENCTIDKNQIIAPYGSQGLFDEYTIRLGEFHKTN